MTDANSPAGGRAASFCNGTTPCASDTVPKPEIWSTLMAVYLGAILLVSVAFNGTLSLVFYKKPQLLSISNCFVLNLACCQLCMAIFVLPFSLVAVVSRGLVYQGAWCNIQGFIFTWVIVALHLSLLIISLDRNYAIMNSLRYPYVFTQKLCSILIGVSWLSGVVISIPPLFDSGLGQYKFHQYQFICTLNWRSGTGYLTIFGVCTFLIPILVQSFCYIKIFKAAVGHSKRSARVQPWVTQSSSKVIRDPEEFSDNSSDSVVSEEVRKKAAGCKAVRTIFIIAFVYCVNWTPYFFDSLLNIVHGVEIPNLSAVTICCIFSSGILNPIVYAYMNRVTRREIGRFLCGSATASDEIISTSMSTYTLAKQNALLRMKSRNVSGVNNDMQTIPEEAEDSGISESRSAHEFQVVEKSDCNVDTSPTIKNGVLLHASSVKFETEDEQITDNIHEERKPDNCIRNAIKDSLEVKYDRTSRNSSQGSKLKPYNRKANSKSARCFDKRKNVRRAASEMGFSSGRRKRKRDYGSFLYFDNFPAHSKRVQSTTELSRGSTKGSRRFSMNPEQEISVDTRPKPLKFRFSISDADSLHETVEETFIKQQFSPVIEDSESSSEFAVFGDTSTERRVQLFNVVGHPDAVPSDVNTPIPEPEVEYHEMLNIDSERVCSALRRNDNASPSGIRADVALHIGSSEEVDQIDHVITIVDEVADNDKIVSNTG